MGTEESTADMDGHRLDDRVVALLHEAALDERQWPRASGLIDEACGSMGNILVASEGGPSNHPEIYFTRVCYRGARLEAFEHEYFRVYHHRDERGPRLRRLPDSRIVPVGQLYTEEEKRHSVAYNEMLARSDTGHALHARLDGPDGSRIIWTAADPVDDAGWTPARVETIARLLPHIRHYVRVRLALANARAVATTMGALLESAQCGVIELDPSGQIVGMNTRAEAVLRTGDGLTGTGKRLRARLPGEDARLQRLLARALPRFGGVGAGGSMSVSHPVDSPPKLVLHVTPARTGEAGVQPNRVGAIVLLMQPQRRVAVSRELVADALGAHGRGDRGGGDAGRGAHAARHRHRHRAQPSHGALAPVPNLRPEPHLAPGRARAAHPIARRPPSADSADPTPRRFTARPHRPYPKPVAPHAVAWGVWSSTRLRYAQATWRARR